MGEYAMLNNEKVKIGTCADMYYLRYDQRYRVQALPGNVDPVNTLGLRFRIPFLDEDFVEPGQFDSFRRLYPLVRFPVADLIEQPGNIQLTHESGLLLNVPCHHGAKLPEAEGIGVHWNGKAGWFIGLSALQSVEGGVKPVLKCWFCCKAWVCDWDDVLPYVDDKILRNRLEKYATVPVQAAGWSQVQMPHGARKEV